MIENSVSADESLTSPFVFLTGNTELEQKGFGSSESPCSGSDAFNDQIISFTAVADTTSGSRFIRWL